MVTAHRAENTDDSSRLAVIFGALKKIAESLTVIWALHPRTRHTLEKCGGLPMGVPHLHLIEPVGYLDTVQIEKYASVIATDPGGVQKEAFFHGVPCVTLRDETERVELVEAGWNRLTPPVNKNQLIEDKFYTCKNQ